MTMKKLHLCAGGTRIEGFESHDLDMDIRKPLPFPDNSVNFICTEHGLEHTAPREGWSFLEECNRILVSGGVVRIAIPDPVRMWHHANARYFEAVRKGGFGDGSRKDAIKATFFAHGHQAVWTQDLLCVVMQAIGFDVDISYPGWSPHPELRNVEQHGKTVGEDINEMETTVVEGIKR